MSASIPPFEAKLERKSKGEPINSPPFGAISISELDFTEAQQVTVWSYHAKRLFQRPDGYAAWGVHEEGR